MYVADQVNDRVLIYNSIPTGTTNPPANTVLGQSNLNSNSNANAPAANNFANQVGGGPVALQAVNGLIYVADRQYNRVLVFGCGNVPTPTPCTLSCGGEGSLWSEATPSAGFSPRHSFGAVNFQNKMWVIGGNSTDEFNSTGALGDIWNSPDGVNWTQVTPVGNYFGSRYAFSMVVMVDPADGIQKNVAYRWMVFGWFHRQ